MIRGVTLHLWEDSNLLSSRLNVTVKRADKRQNLHEIQDQIGVHPLPLYHRRQVHICDFHREQAWERWLSNSVNECCLVKDRVKEKPHAIAYAKTKKICQKEVHELEELHEWKSNPKLSEYLKNTWLCIQKRWVFAYRQDRLLLSVNTNNGIERQNQSFKYSFLEKRKNSSITSMLTICIEEFLSHKYDSYCDKNRMAPTSYKKYKKTYLNI
ncbi:uncharacterized protein LOC136074655 [Hydra vulgaris]|uniref:Uncharacterized protein LOC136074655 n=1 Tax=Hydra vulgaris TaxID=6087 RepID=A0ABM4B2Q7_HYDVU